MVQGRPAEAEVLPSPLGASAQSTERSGAISPLAAPLVSNRDKSPERPQKGCPKPVPGIRFKLPNGRLLPVPCNLSTCPACSRTQAIVTAAMVGIDAEAEQPRVVTTFTTRDPIDAAGLREAQRQIARLVRSELGPARYCSFLEFTTGEAASSGGIRRPHQHALWKDLDPEQGHVVAGIAGHVMEQKSGAWRHDVEEIRTPAGCAHYVASHHQKESQAPPRSWGPTRRVRPSKGYWSQPAKLLRERAKTRVRDTRLRHHLEQAMIDQGVPLDVLEEIWDDYRDRPRAQVVRVKERFGRTIEVL